MSTWEEIRRLAADLQRVQLGESVKKLSERNVIEIVSKLIEDSLIDVIYTIDGKEYVTRQHLTTQVRNEVIANGGKVNLTDLVQVLNIPFHHIEQAAQEITKSDPSFVISIGQLISREHLNDVAEQISNWLAEEGTLTFSQISKSYDLPSELLREVVYEELGKRIQGIADSEDSNCLYTDAYIGQQLATIRGLLSGVTKSTSVSKLASEFQIKPGIFFGCLDKLVARGELGGTLVGGHYSDRAIFVPEAFSLAVDRWTSDFYTQNGYVEYSNLKKLGVDPLMYLHKQLPNASTCLFLDKCVLDSDVVEQTDAAISEHIQQHGWASISEKVPSVVDEKDLELYVSRLLKTHTNWTLCDEFVYTEKFIENCNTVLEPVVNERLDKDSSKFITVMKENAKARETSSQKDNDNDNDFSTTKKKGKGAGKKATQTRKKDDREKASSQNSQSVNEIISEQEIKVLLLENLKDNCPDPILREAAEKLHGLLNGKLRARLESIFLQSEVGNKESRKKTGAEFQEQFATLLQAIFMYNMGASEFPDVVAANLKQLLLRGFCTDLVNLAICYMTDVPMKSPLTPKVRDETIASMNSLAKTAFEKWVKSLNEKDLTNFFASIDEVCGPKVCSISFRYPDKKQRAELVSKHEQDLCKQLEKCSVTEPAVALLLAVSILFSRTSKCTLHATGKFVPQIVDFLNTKINEDLHSFLDKMQRAVVQFIKEKEKSPDMLADKVTELKAKVVPNLTQNNLENGSRSS